jgi:serine/threonine-protein kinase HipA
LSIAGLQDKVAIYSEGEQWYLVDGGELASTHILKPEPVSSVLETAREIEVLRPSRGCHGAETNFNAQAGPHNLPYLIL